MPAWEDEARWEAVKRHYIGLLIDGPPPDTIAELGVSWVTSGLGPLPVRGYACVVAKRHVVEPFELEGGEREAFWEDVLVAAEALSRHLRPAKMNYEIHGNTIPHLHVHLLPRAPGDGYGLALGDFAVLPEGIEIIGGMFSHVEAGMALSAAQYASRSRGFFGELLAVSEVVGIICSTPLSIADIGSVSNVSANSLVKS